MCDIFTVSVRVLSVFFCVHNLHNFFPTFGSWHFKFLFVCLSCVLNCFCLCSLFVFFVFVFVFVCVLCLCLCFLFVFLFVFVLCFFGGVLIAGMFSKPHLHVCIIL